MTALTAIFTDHANSVSDCLNRASSIADYAGCVSSIVWSPYLLLFLLGLGVYLSIGLRGISLRWIPRSLALLWRGRKSNAAGDITPFQSLMTALSSTVGTGNIAGVAGAIALGGPGAIFWMWITALMGMATKYAECLLGVHFREENALGQYVGGPMYYIKNGLGKGWGWLAVLFAVCAAVTAFGIGNAVQANEVTNALINTFQLGDLHNSTLRLGIGIAIAALVGSVILGGIRRIGAVAAKLVPLMALCYIGGAVLILLLNADRLPAAFALIIDGAFNGTAAAGGFAGAAIQKAVQMGIARGVFSNESGMGSAPIAHAAAQTSDPVQQASIAMLGTFIDTIIVCSMTALVIIVSGVWSSGDSGAVLSASAFAAGMPGGDYIVTFGLAIFAFTTLIGWSYYGERCIEFLLGARAIIPYRIAWVVVIPLGAYQKQNLVWTLADILNGLMVFPNLIALTLLSPVVFKLTRDYQRRQRTA